MASRFILNETSYFGSGARKELKNEIAKRGFRKAFIVADKDLIKFGIVEMVTNEITGTSYEIFSEFKANPTVKNVKDGVAAFNVSGADFIIAIGGG